MFVPGKRRGLDMEKVMDELVAKSVEDYKAGVRYPDVKTLEERFPDPVERIEYLYGPKERPYSRTKPLGYTDTWDERRLKIATNPEYTDRCRKSYAFADLLGREYDGVVFE